MTAQVWDCKYCRRTVTLTTGWSGMVNNICYGRDSIHGEHDWVLRHDCDCGKGDYCPQYGRYFRRASR